MNASDLIKGIAADNARATRERRAAGKELYLQKKEGRSKALQYIKDNWVDENSDGYYTQDSDVAEMFGTSTGFIKKTRAGLKIINRQERLAQSLIKLGTDNKYVGDMVSALGGRVSYFTIVKCLQAYGLRYLRKNKND